MKQPARSVIYLALALALLGIFLAGGEAWARPLARPPAQTVPSLTPVQPFEPTVIAPVTPETGVTPDPNATPAPNTTPASRPSTGALALTKTTAQREVWPGMTATFTLTLVNTGTASLRQVTLEDVLPAGMEPAAVLAGAGAGWEGRVLRVRAPVLAPGGVLVVVYTARIRADIAPDAILLNRAVAAAAGGQQAVSYVVLGQPPLELPPTGGAWAPGGRPR